MMQLGTRWTSGDEPPAAVPDGIRAAIAGVDAALPADEHGQPRPGWTLTWLERRPVAELDSGVVVTLDAEGTAVVTHDTDDEFA